MKGFSMIEIVVVIAIVAVLAIIAVPRFFDIDIFRDRTFYDETIAGVRYAQKLAVATRCPVRVQFTTNGFTLYRPASASTCDSGPYDTVVTDPLGAQPTFTRTAPSGITLTAANFSFTAAGNTAADVTINVGSSRSFRVHAATGFVQEL